MKTAELRELNPEQLNTKLAETRKQLSEAKRAQAAGELVNPRVITKSRKDIARLQTIIKESTVQDTKEDK